jgi:signal transduction histidine kinase
VQDELLVRTARLALVGRLARGIMHELNNPLFVVLGLVELVQRDLEPGTKAHERLALALSTGEEIKQLVTTVLDLARDEQPGKPERLSLEEPARQAAGLARRLSLSKELEIVERNAAEPATVLGRPQQLRQLFLMLLVLAERPAAGPATMTLEVTREGEEAVARLAAEVSPPGDAALELDAATAIARAHGGSLAVGVDRGFRAELRLPLV